MVEKDLIIQLISEFINNRITFSEFFMSFL